MATEFGYLLNAMERAACESNPAKHNYYDKRIAVLGHVSAIEAERDRLRSTISRLREYAWHKLGSDSRFSYDTEPGSLPCDCGYDELLAALEETK